MKKSMKYLVPASLIGGGMVLGSIFSPISLSGAQTGDSGESTTDSTADSQTDTVEESGDHSGKGRRGGRGVAKEVLEDLGLSVEDLKAGNEAGQTLVEIAAEAGITEAQLVEAIETATSERLAAAVTEGKIDAEKAAEIEAGMAEKISERINTVREGRGEGSGRRGQIREQLSETLTELGLDSDEIKAGREAGQTLAEIAAESGVSEQDLVDALISGAEERLAEASENGNIDDERLAEIEANLEEKISEMVNKAPGEGGRHGGRGHGGAGEDNESSSEI